MTRTPPAAVDAERIVLGAMMLHPAAIDPVTRRITAEQIYQPNHQAIFRAIVDAFTAGDPTGPTAITARLAATGDLTRAGGAPYLHELVAAAEATAGDPGWYADHIARAHTARGLLKVAAHAGEYAHGLAMDNPREALARVQAELDTISGDPTDGDPVAWPDLSERALNSIEAAAEPDADDAVISTGLPDLDEALGGGLRNGQVVVVGGRTGMGKSVLARTIARAAAFDQRLPTLLFSLEMTDVEVFNCVAAAELRMDLAAINAGELTDNDWVRLARFCGDTADVPLYVDDTPGVSLADIRGKANRLRQRHGLRLVIVDYLQLVEVGARENRQVAIAALSRGFRVLAQQLGVALVLVAQLNRGPEMRVDKRPVLADLRESGAVENDANVVILVHREDYYVKDSPRQGEADLIIAKHRAGRTQDVTVAAQLHLSRFVSMAPAANHVQESILT